MKKASLKRIVVLRVVGIGIVFALIGAIFLLSDQVQEVRRALLIKQLSLETSLKDAVYQASLQEQLEQRKESIGHIERMMPVKDEIGSIISSFENEAKKIGVTVRVPKVEEETVTDKNGDKIKQVGQIEAVLMQISAQGEPTNLIEYMHAIEHLPYMLGIVSFTFDSDAASASRGGSFFTVPRGTPPGDGEKQQVEKRRATLIMEIRLTTRVEK